MSAARESIKTEFGIFIDYIKKNRWHIAGSVGLFIAVYLPWIVNMSPRIDGEVLINNPRYYSGYTFNGRQGNVLTEFVFDYRWFNPMFAIISGFLMLSVAGILFGYMCYRAGARRAISAWFGLLCFTCPVMVELIYFDMLVFKAGWAYVLTIVSVGLTVVAAFRKKIWLCLPAIPLMIWAICTYESFAVIYVTTIVFCFIMIYYNRNIKDGDGLKITAIDNGPDNTIEKVSKISDITYVKFIGESVAVISLSMVLNNIITKYFFTSDSAYVMSKFMWNQRSVKACIKSIITSIKKGSLGIGEFYSVFMGITALLLIIFVIVHLFTHKFKAVTLLYVAAVFVLQLCPYLLTIYLGGAPDMRAQISYPISLAFNIILLVSMCRKKILSFAVYIITICTLWTQIQNTMRFEYTDYVRAEEDIRLAGQIDEHIGMVTPDNNKPVFFVGIHRSKLNNACIRGEMIGISFFGFTESFPPHYMFSTQRACDVMRVMGINRTYLTDEEQMKTARSMALSMPVFPCEGSVVDAGDFVVVKLSEDEYAEELIEPAVTDKTDLSDDMLAEEPDNLQISLDNVKDEDGILTLSGWSVRNGYDSSNVKSSIVLYREDGECYEFATCKARREDVVQVLGNESYTYAGYVAKAPVADLPDDYESMSIAVKYTLPDGNEEYYKTGLKVK